MARIRTSHITKRVLLWPRVTSAPNAQNPSLDSSSQLLMENGTKSVSVAASARGRSITDPSSQPANEQCVFDGRYPIHAHCKTPVTSPIRSPMSSPIRICHGCFKRVDLNTALNMHGESWHSECFKCERCGEGIDPQGPHTVTGSYPVHTGCVR
eukprot:NODE_4473_length_782_cov_7.667176_g4314_i0.p1 GENE.NODE_4473_length_782_cov_7.667176_g4314_i0~~NODE_4473_length_782_cov_7.667176_g4314_i0.p1  ORF type:complete len:154 (+),score=9.42 NODE_4473_length_782_cov_7.667176_g4314_i0:276-737(+)